MNQILNKVRDIDPNNSENIKETLSVFFQNLQKHVDVDSNRWLRSLESIISRFPKYCMSHRTTIETYLANFLDSTDYGNVIEAAKCAQAVQQVRPTQEKAATAKTCWREQMNVLCDAAHKLIGAMFPKAIDIYKGSDNLQQKDYSNSPLAAALAHINTITAKNKINSSVNKRALLCTRLKNVFVFLQAMLVEVYPVAKPVRPQIILDVIVRALSVSSGNNTSGQGLPDIATVKIQSLRSLDALVVCLGSNLIPFSPLVFRFVMQTLRWSSDNPSDESSSVRCAAYSSLGNWLNVLHAHRSSYDTRGRCWEDDLTEHVVSDITPTRHVVQLTMSAQPTKHLSKKAKRKMANTMLQESSIVSHAPGEKNKVPVSVKLNDEVAIAALECAEIFLMVCGVFLKPATHKLFQERIVRECYASEMYCMERTLRLLHVLEASRKSAPPALPPPTQYCLHLYSVLLNTHSGEISKFCTQALMDIRLHLHCSPPSLNFALEVPQEKEKALEARKKQISERNRAALEAFLGTDGADEEEDDQDDDDDVISIPDEPANKRARLEDNMDNISISDVDNISVSSESANTSESEPSIINQVVEAVIERENTDSNEIQSVDNDLGDAETQLVEIQDIETQLLQKTDEEAQRFEKLSSETHLIQESNEVADNSEISNEVVEVNVVVEEPADIHEAKTQIPLNTSNDTIDEEERPLSMEVGYDYPNTGTEKVPVLEKMEDENLPSTNDTDDVQITCGQVIKSSQDDNEKKSEIDAKDEVPKVNGVEKSPEKVVQNGDVTASGPDEVTVTAKVAATNDEVTVEDMLADFVDEVSDEAKTQA